MFIDWVTSRKRWKHASLLWWRWGEWPCMEELCLRRPRPWQIWEQRWLSADIDIEWDPSWWAELAWPPTRRSCTWLWTQWDQARESYHTHCVIERSSGLYRTSPLIWMELTMFLPCSGRHWKWYHFRHLWNQWTLVRPSSMGIRMNAHSDEASRPTRHGPSLVNQRIPWLEQWRHTHEYPEFDAELYKRPGMKMSLTMAFNRGWCVTTHAPRHIRTCWAM